MLIGSSLVTGGWAQKKRTSGTVLNMQAQGSGSLSVQFVAAPDGAALAGGTSGQRSLNLGSVSYNTGSRMANVQTRSMQGRFVVSTKFGLQIQDSSRQFSSATVLAAVAFPSPAYTVRLDGLKLETIPQLIQGQARIGLILQHRLEIEVPTSLTEKNSEIQNAIVFQVIPN